MSICRVKMNKVMSNHSGFGILNTLIGVLFASIMLLLLSDQYIRIKQHARDMRRFLIQTLELQDVAIKMKQSIVQAGFTPCLNVDQLTQNSLSRVNALRVLPAELQINRMGIPFSQVHDVTGTRIRLRDHRQWFGGENILIADCAHVETARIQTIETLPRETWLILTKPLMFKYSKPVYVGEWIQEVFSIQTIKQNTGLYYDNHHREEWSSLIKHMQLEQLHGYVQIVLQTEHDELHMEINVKK